MSEPSRRSLVAKLAEVMAAVERIPKRGRNEFHRYDYATEADIVATVRQELASRQVMLIPSIVGEVRHAVGEKGSVLTVLEMEMEFLDGETNASIKKPWRGYGTDKEDKGGYKAMTGGEKYFLLKTFLMPTGDDPEVAEAEQKRAPAPPQGRSQSRPAVAAANRGAAPQRPAPTTGKPVDGLFIKAVDKKSKDNKTWLEVALSDGRTVIAKDASWQPELLKYAVTVPAVPVSITTTPNPKGPEFLESYQRAPQPEAK